MIWGYLAWVQHKWYVFAYADITYQAWAVQIAASKKVYSSTSAVRDARDSSAALILAVFQIVGLSSIIPTVVSRKIRHAIMFVKAMYALARE